MTIDNFFRGRKVLVFGLGRQGGGVGDANWLVKRGYSVRATDEQTLLELGLQAGDLDERLQLSLGAHQVGDIDWADIVVKNPGVADDHPLIQSARAAGKSVVTSIALFVKYAPLSVIGISGTRGKSTTTALIFDLLSRAFPGQVISGGNIPGTSGLALFDEIVGKKWAVLELSSFQLHQFHDLRLSPHLAVITNLYPDHLNRYPSLEAYRDDKEALVRYQKPSDITLVNTDNPGALQIAQASTGRVIHFSAADTAAWPTLLLGDHNRENLAAMAAVGRALGISEALCLQVAASFPGLPFRQQLIATIGSVRYINDTTATTPVAAQKAVYAQTTPFVLICGGDTKQLPFTELIHSLKNNKLVKKIIFLGSQNIPNFVSELRAAIPDKIAGQVASMRAAVDLATSLAVAGDTVLLSPGFASFDLFQNEFDRGRQFNDCVNQLKSNI